MNEKKLKRINMLMLALGIALMPPLWAVIAPYVGITTGTAALICAGVYVANGNRKSEAVRIIIGFICGDIWAVMAIWIMEKLQFNSNVELYLTLFVLGGLAVIIGETLNKWIFLPSWLCGWAIGLSVMGSLLMNELGTLPVQIGVAMIVGVVYVGIGVDTFQKWVVRMLMKCDHG